MRLFETNRKDIMPGSHKTRNATGSPMAFLNGFRRVGVKDLAYDFFDLLKKMIVAVFA